MFCPTMGLEYGDFVRALEGERLPAVVVDLDAFDRNVERHLAITRARNLPLRPATKSVRVVSLLRRVLAREGTQGLMCFAVREAEALHARGFDDLFIAYPPRRQADLDALARLTKDGARVTVAIDDAEALRALASTGEAHGVSVRIALCVDMSLRLGGGHVHLGVRRSPLHDVRDVLALVDVATSVRGVELVGLLGYEAQVAGLGDASPFDNRVARAGKAWIRRASMRELGARRAAIVKAVRARGVDLAFVNGGGTGSVDLTDESSGVTEITAGSGFFKPLLFDGYESVFVKSLEPACFFALEVTRRPAPGVVTCFGGGYVASGSAGPDKLPRPFLPRGLDLLSAEGAGEVQTPVAGTASNEIALGAPIIFRHAKAGEIMERFDVVLLLESGRVVERVTTYRGDCFCFA